MRTPFEKNTQPVARSLSESLRDAHYSCAIQTFKSDTKLTIDFLAHACIGAFYATLVCIGIFGLGYWLVSKV